MSSQGKQSVIDKSLKRRMVLPAVLSCYAAHDDEVAGSVDKALICRIVADAKLGLPVWGRGNSDGTYR